MLLFLQAEIAKRLNIIIGQILPYLSQDHQQQIHTAVERAKAISMGEVNVLMVSVYTTKRDTTTCTRIYTQNWARMPATITES